MLTIDIPMADALRLEHLVLDLNGTLCERGELIDGAAERLDRLVLSLEVQIATAGTIGRARELGRSLGIGS
jgi:soluble P-type ATPase